MATASKALQTTTSERLKISFETYGREETTIQHLAALASCFERPFPKLVQAMYLETLSGLTEEQVITALERAQHQEAKFFPPPARLKELAVDETPDQCSEREALDGMQWVIWRIRRHGVESRARNGALIRAQGRDEQGVWHEAEYEQIPPPPTPERVRNTLEEFGYGDVQTGVKMVAEHPLVKYDPDEYPTVGLRLVAIEKLEARWVQAWRKAAKG